MTNKAQNSMLNTAIFFISSLGFLVFQSQRDIAVFSTSEDFHFFSKSAF